MSHLPIVNTAIFISVAFLHALCVAYQTPVVVGSIELPLWLSAVAAVGAAVMAYLNWQSLPQRNTLQWLRLLLALLVIDMFVLLVSWMSGWSYWGLNGDTYLWFMIIDLVFAGIVLQAMQKRLRVCKKKSHS